jgi:uncharacterized protein YbjT (DUF2867 family)
MGKRLLLAGGSGEVGHRLLQKLIARNDVYQIHLINRSHSPVVSPKVVQHNIDFETLSSLNLNLKFHMAYCCLGTTIKKAGSKTAFEKIDLHYVQAFAKLAKNHQCDHLAVISSVGANAKSSNFYLNTKGRIEGILSAMPWVSLWIVRPGLLAGERREFRLSERLGGILMAIINPFMIGPTAKFRSIQMEQVASAMSVLVSTHDSGTTILHNDELRKRASLAGA